MYAKWMRWWGMLAVMLVIAPMIVAAQDYRREPRWGYARGWPRGEIHVMNDWQDAVRVSMWSVRRERIGDWIIHIPSSLVVNQWVGDVASSSPRDFLLLHNLWTTSGRLIRSRITSRISTG